MFLPINSSGNKSRLSELFEVVEEELFLEKKELPPPSSEPVINENGAEEIKNILRHPGIPIQTPVPLRLPINGEENEILISPPPRPKLEKTNSSTIYPPLRPSTPSNPILLEPRICRDAKSRESPIYWACLRVIFDLIPSEWFFSSVHTWEKSLPGSEEPLKRALLEHVQEKELGPNILKRMATIGLDNFKNIINTCSKDSLSLLAAKRPFDVEELIRINVERRPTLDINAFVGMLYTLIVLINKTIPSWDELAFHTNFLKELSYYPSPKYIYSIHDSDKIYIFAAQLQRSTLKRPPFLENRERPSPLYTSSSIINHLNEISSILGEGLHRDLIDRIETFISYSQEDERPPPYADYQRKLWLKCDDALFGLSPLFKDLAIFNKVCTLLKSLSPLTTHPKAVEFINETLFQGKSEVLSVMLYKSWWFGGYLRGLPHSLSDRMVDWYMQQFLEDSRTWELSKTVQLVRFLFLENHPVLPFNAPRAERMFFSLNLDRHSF